MTKIKNRYITAIILTSIFLVVKFVLIFYFIPNAASSSPGEYKFYEAVISILYILLGFTACFFISLSLGKKERIIFLIVTACLIIYIVLSNIYNFSENKILNPLSAFSIIYLIPSVGLEYFMQYYAWAMNLDPYMIFFAEPIMCMLGITGGWIFSFVKSKSKNYKKLIP